MKRAMVMGLAVLAMTAISASARADVTSQSLWASWFQGTVKEPHNAYWYDTIVSGGTNPNTAHLTAASGVQIRPGHEAGYQGDEGPRNGGGAADYHDSTGNVANVQSYNAEMIMARMIVDDSGQTYLNIGIVTGMNPTTGAYNGTVFGGDLFLRWDGTQTGNVPWDMAVRIANDPRGSAYGTSAPIGTIYTDPMGSTSNPSDFPGNTPYRVTQDRSSGTAIVTWGYGSYGHNFVDIKIPVTAGLAPGSLAGLDAHWSVSCGNDVINAHFSGLRPPIPEPSSMALLGLGVLGMALRKRFLA